MNMFSQVF